MPSITTARTRNKSSTRSVNQWVLGIQGPIGVYEKILASNVKNVSDLLAVPDSWFVWRFEQARAKHWSVDGLIAALNNMELLTKHCQQALRNQKGDANGRPPPGTPTVEEPFDADAEYARIDRALANARAGRG